MIDLEKKVILWQIYHGESKRLDSSPNKDIGIWNISLHRPIYTINEEEVTVMVQSYSTTIIQPKT